MCVGILNFFYKQRYFYAFFFLLINSPPFSPASTRSFSMEGWLIAIFTRSLANPLSLLSPLQDTLGMCSKETQFKCVLFALC